MEKLIFLARRAPGLEREEFQERYLGRHAVLVMRHFPRLRRYVVNVVELGWETRADDELAHVDAIAEMWFDELGDFTDRARRYDSAEAAVAIDESAAAIYTSVIAYRVQEQVQRDYDCTWPDGQPSPGVKMVYPVRRKDGLTREQFADHWLHTHVPLVLQYLRGISRYATNVVVAPLGKAPEIDGIVELHYPNPDDLTGPRYNAPEAEQLMADDVAQFITQTGTAYRTTEYVMRA